MKLTRLLAAAAALSMAASPALAAPANPAASLSVAHATRAAAPTDHGNGLLGDAIFPIVGLIALIVLVVVIADSDSDSP